MTVDGREGSAAQFGGLSKRMRNVMVTSPGAADLSAVDGGRVYCG